MAVNQKSINKEHSLDKVLSTKEACDHLSLSKATLYRIANQGKLTKIQLSKRRVGWRSAELVAYIEGNAISPPLSTAKPEHIRSKWAIGLWLKPGTMCFREHHQAKLCGQHHCYARSIYSGHITFGECFEFFQLKLNTQSPDIPGLQQARNWS